MAKNTQPIAKRCKMCIRDREAAFNAGDVVDTEALKAKGLVKKTLDGVKAVSYTHLDVYKRQLVRLPSGEMRNVPVNCTAVIGQVSNIDHENVNLGKACLLYTSRCV